MSKPEKAPQKIDNPNPGEQKQTLLTIKPKQVHEADPIEIENTAISQPIVEPVAKPKVREKPIIILQSSQKPIAQESTEIDPHQQVTEQQQQLSSIFQAVGIIPGTVRFDDNGKSFVNVGSKEYPLYYIGNKHKKRAYDALVKEIAATGNHQQRLIVYPRILHFPKREQIHQVSFQLVGFDQGRVTDGIEKQLQDFEFTLCGLWQFIPVCQTPCITVLRNFTSERLDYIKKESTSTLSKVKFMKASHVPVLWRDAPVKPFRFNPKLPKEQQGHASFVEIKAKFLPQRDVFGFDSLVALPQDKPPKYFKARKEDKALALKTLNQLKNQRLKNANS